MSFIVYYKFWYFFLFSLIFSLLTLFFFSKIQLEKFQEATKLYLRRGRWIEIAKFVGCGVTPDQCMNKFGKYVVKNKKNESNLKVGEWTLEEVSSFVLFAVCILCLWSVWYVLCFVFVLCLFCVNMCVWLLLLVIMCLHGL